MRKINKYSLCLFSSTLICLFFIIFPTIIFATQCDDDSDCTSSEKCDGPGPTCTCTSGTRPGSYATSSCAAIAATTSAVTTPTTASESTWVLSPDVPYKLETPLGAKVYVNNLADYISTIYNFALSIIGILATVAIIYGGVRWASAAGNESSITAAKETIFSALIGLIIAVGSYTILNFINPQLVNLKGANIMKIIPPNITSSNYSGCGWQSAVVAEQTGLVKTDDSACKGSKPTNTADEELDGPEGTDASDYEYNCYCTVSGNCSPAPADSKCSVASLEAAGGNCFGTKSDIEKASAICQGESGGNLGSQGPILCTDADKTPTIFGLFQFNLRAHNATTSIANCKNLLGNLGTCQSYSSYVDKQGKTQNYCASYNCSVAAGKSWTNCKSAIMDIKQAVTEACRIKSTQGWKAWSYNNENCHW